MSSMETQSPRRTRLRAKQNFDVQQNAEAETVVTPTKSTAMANAITPRRSTRKSCKPILDYYEIINGESPSKKKVAEEDHWNPAIVGRTSEKRGKKRANGNKLKKRDDVSTDDDENDVANISFSIFSPNSETKKELEEETTEEIKSDSLKEQLKEDPTKVDSNKVLECEKDAHLEEGLTKEDNNNRKMSETEKCTEVEMNKNVLIEYNNKVSEIDCLELGLAPLAEEPDTENEIEKEMEKAADDEMESLILYDEDETSPKNEQNALNATFDTSDCIIISPNVEKQENYKNTLQVPAIIITSPKSPHQSFEEKERTQIISKTPRIQTPYKPKKAQLKDIEEISKAENLSVIDEIVPQGIRKRSASISIDVRGLPATQKTACRVTFYSPANQTNYINDSEEEEEIAKENMKGNIEEEPSFITKRRRRSMSFDATMMRKPAIKKPLTPMKAAGSRTKLPNFAAIHKKQYEQMENIVDHVARKAERAKVLTSATKKTPGSSGKTQTPGRFTRLSTFEKEKTKATRKIDLGTNNSRIPVIKPVPVKIITPPTRFKKAASAEPHSFKNLHRIKSKTISKKPLPKAAFSKSAVDITVAAMKSMENTSLFTFKSLIPRGEEISSSAFNKIEERRKRNMNMFENRQKEESIMKIQKKRDEIRGVRLNRRYLLQMEHRRNMNKLN